MTATVNITMRENTFIKNMKKTGKIMDTIITTMNLMIMGNQEKKNQILTQSQQQPLQHQLPEELLQPPQLQEDHTSVEQPGGQLRQRKCLVKDSCLGERGIPATNTVALDELNKQQLP